MLYEVITGPRGRADHLRQLRYVAGAVRDRQVGSQGLVLLHRERAQPGCGACGSYNFV